MRGPGNIKGPSGRTVLSKIKLDFLRGLRYLDVSTAPPEISFVCPEKAPTKDFGSLALHFCKAVRETGEKSNG